MAASGILYRRSPHLVSYWRDGRLVFHNFATGRRAAGTALTIGLLDYFSTWQPADALIARAAMPADALERAIDGLVRASLLQRSDRRRRPAEREMDRWASWNPAAGLFHFSTKDPPFHTNELDSRAFLQGRAAERSSPPAFKSYPRRRGVRLPHAGAARVCAPFEDVLLARRTWRRFGARPMSVDALAVLLRLTFGARAVVDLGAGGQALLRTSPSAGATNPLEAYVVARRVRGLPPGIYHYAPLEHRLVRIRRGLRKNAIESYLPGQAWYGGASVLVVMTAVFARTEWKYPFARAYRTILLEAGHFAQTFCLTAAALGLAPFCSAALADTLVERDLGIDGVGESAIYACGAGTRPRGAVWAPMPDGEAVPRLVWTSRTRGADARD